MIEPYVPDWHDCNALCIGEQHAVVTYASIDGSPDADLLNAIEHVFGQDGWEIIEARRVHEMPNLSSTEAAARFQNYEQDGDSPSMYRYPVLVIIRPAVTLP